MKISIICVIRVPLTKNNKHAPFNTDETLILKGIKFRGTKTKGHEYKHIEDAWDEGSPNTLKK